MLNFLREVIRYDEKTSVGTTHGRGKVVAGILKI